MQHIDCSTFFVCLCLKHRKLLANNPCKNKKKMHRNNFWPYGYFVFILCTKDEKKKRKIPLTYCFYKLLKEATWEQGLRQLSEKHLECSCDNVYVLPLAVVQIQLLFWENTGRNGTTGFNETITRH